MQLTVLLPTTIFLEEEVNKVTAEGRNGSFGLLPEHIDFVSALVPGILSFETSQGEEKFIAIDEGILVKNSTEILVSTRQAIHGTDLETLEKAVKEQFETLDERQKQSRTVLAKLEATFVKGLLEHGRANL